MDPSTERSTGSDAKRPTHVFVIARRRKGREVTGIVNEVHGHLDREGANSEVAIVTKKRDVRRLAARAVKDGFDVVLAVGGDGTVLQVATSLAGSQVALGIVPTGTGNLLAGNLGVPHAPADAVHTAVAGRRRRIDIGRVSIGGTRRAFTVACGIGFDADVMDRTDSEQKGRWGKLAYLANALRESGKIRNVTHHITLDGKAHSTEAAQVLIANFGRMSAGLKARGIRPDDGLLDVFVVRASGPLPALLAGWEAMRMTDLGESDNGRVFRAQARRVRVETKPNRRVETDGSVIGKTPVKVSIRPDALTVMVPTRPRATHESTR